LTINHWMLTHALNPRPTEFDRVILEKVVRVYPKIFQLVVRAGLKGANAHSMQITDNYYLVRLAL